MKSLLTAFILCLYLFSQSSHAVYGEDNRRDFFEINDTEIKELAKAIAYRVDKHELRGWTFQRYWGVITKKFFNKNICPKERFLNQDTIRLGCSAVLIGPKTMMTAGHCLSKFTCKNDLYYWTLGYYQSSKDQSFSKHHKNNFYKCKKIIKRQYNPNTEISYVIFEIEKNISTIKPVEIAYEQHHFTNELIVMGHPQGLPLKISDQTFTYNGDGTHFIANSDIAGESGGAMAFELQSKKLVGMLIYGTRNYQLNQESNCMKATQLYNEEAQEVFIRTSAIEELKQISF